MSNKGSENKEKSLSSVSTTTIDAVEPKNTLASRKLIRLGTMVWAKLDKAPWWPGKCFPFNNRSGLFHTHIGCLILYYIVDCVQR